MRKYFYECGCGGCSERSKFVTPVTYIRLQSDEVWVSKKCKVEGDVVREWLGGKLVVLSDF